jgi:hypothetical protein
MNYRKVMTKLNENNVTFVIQTISSMNYFDSSRKYKIGTAKSFGIHEAALIYKIIVNALLESK